MISEPGDTNHEVLVTETFHVQTDDELTEKKLKLIEADDQAIQTIPLGLPEDIYAAVDSCETAQEIWFTSKDGESIESYYHRFLKLINDFKWKNTFQKRLPRISLNPRNRKIAQPGMNMGQDRQMQMVGARTGGNTAGHNGNQIRYYNCRGVGHFARNCTVRPKRRDAAYLQTQLLIAQKEEAGIQLQAEEFDLMVAAADLDEIEEVNANCILMTNLQQASTSGTQTDKALVYDSDGSAEVHNHENCYDDDIFDMFTQEEHYTELLEPIPESHQVPQNDNVVISEVTSVEQGGEMVEQHSVNVEETRALYDSLYQNLAIEVEKVNSVNRKSTIVTLQRVVKHRMTLETHNWSYSAHQELHKIVKDEILPIVNQVDARVQNFEIQFLKEAAKFVGDFKSLAKEADESLAQHKALELEIERLLRAVVSQDIMFVVQKASVVDTLNLQTELERVDNTKTRRPQPRSNTKNDRVLSASKSNRSKNKEVEVEEHHRNLLLFKNTKHMSSACNNTKLDSQNVISKVAYAMCKQCLISVNHDVCLRNYVNGKTSRGKIIASSESESQFNCSNGDNACTSNTLEPKIKRFPNSTSLLSRLSKFVYGMSTRVLSKHMIGNLKLLINFVWKFIGTVRFRNDHVAVIMGFGDLQWGNILITRVYFVEGLGHNLFSVAQFCDSNLEVAFRRNVCFVRNLEGVDLLSGNRTTNLYTINLHEMASASPICLMARASSTKSWLRHQRLSHLNFGTINDLTKNDLVSGLPKFKYHKEHLCPSCEQGKSKRASHPPNPVPNSRVYNRRTKKIMETMNVSFDELSAMAFEQRSLKPGLQSMTSGQISLGLDLTYASSTITTQQSTEGELDLLFEAMYDDYIGGQPLAASRTDSAAQAQQVRQMSMTSM
nr:retrovirus-related Pol polyprotein from transposon TNT 1-94 [Tanacetum cinerariifolium]